MLLVTVNRYVELLVHELNQKQWACTLSRTVTDNPSLFAIVIMFLDGVYPHPKDNIGIQGRVTWLTNNALLMISVRLFTLCMKPLMLSGPFSS